ncbi:MAG: nucleotidyltransferase domain-containing protein [Sulfolobales archaeon]
MGRVSIDLGVLQLIKQTILEEAGKLGVEVERIILFGSRVRGEEREGSDWDVLVVVKGNMSWKVFFKLQSRLRMRLFRLLGGEIDLIIIEKKRFDERKDLWGSIEYTAAREGVTV